MDIRKIKETIEEVKQDIGCLEEYMEKGYVSVDMEMQLESEKIKLWALEEQLKNRD